MRQNNEQYQMVHDPSHFSAILFREATFQLYCTQQIKGQGSLEPTHRRISYIFR